MKRTWLVLTAIIVCCSILSRGEVHGKKPVSDLEEYKWALQFGIQQDFLLGTLESGSISCKRHVSPRTAIRIALELGYWYMDRESGRLKEHDYESRLSVVLQRYVNPKSRAKFYWGAGPFTEYDYFKRYYRSSNIEKYEGSVGIIGVAGIEWFATSEISLHAEYSAFAKYMWVKQSGYNSDNFIIRNSQTVLFGMSIYF